jgi:2-polyprenyl-3-methyl-5-hydroxy-6-metoxy-1,4-benzoquinol methylase
MAKAELQFGFSTLYREAAFDAAARERKGRKALAILEDCLGDLSAFEALDVGCSTGFMTRLYAMSFKTVVGTDVDEPAVRFAARHHVLPNLFWTVQDSQQLGFRDESFDAITCTHIYEHVPDASRLMEEIYRLLKPGGACFFSAGNRLSLIEPHYRLPLLSVIPKWLAHKYLRLAGRGDHYYENHRSLTGLRRLASRFELIDYTLNVVRDPERFHAEDLVVAGSVRQRLILAILRTTYWLCPTYLWVLRKHARADATGRAQSPG